MDVKSILTASNISDILMNISLLKLLVSQCDAMNPAAPLVTHSYELAHVEIYSSESAMGTAAAARAAKLIRGALSNSGGARIMIGTGNSQRAVVHSLVANEALDWKRVTVFHMDEYVGIAADHPASFRRWLRERVAEKCHPGAIHYMEGDATHLEAEIQRYGDLLDAAPVDVAFVGFGENGHIAFNDPPVADFTDP